MPAPHCCDRIKKLNVNMFIFLYGNNIWNRNIGKEVNLMKKGIHPDYEIVKVHCACGNTFEAGSTKEELKVEICSECHPFFTGKSKAVEKGGRVERFKKKFNMD